MRSEALGMRFLLWCIPASERIILRVLDVGSGPEWDVPNSFL
jgi:hypothetical protein